MKNKNFELVDMLGECWNKYLDIQRDIPFNNDDRDDFRFHIHALQRIVLYKIGLKEKEDKDGSNN